MGILTDGPATHSRRAGGPGAKMVRLYRDSDEDDRALIREWVGRLDRKETTLQFIVDKINEHHDIGYTTVERGLSQLKRSQWEC